MQVNQIQRDLLTKMRDKDAQLLAIGRAQAFISQNSEENIDELYASSTIRALVNNQLLIPVTDQPNFAKYKLNEKRRTFIDTL